MLIAMSQSPDGMENAKLLYNLSGGNNLGAMAQMQLAAMPRMTGAERRAERERAKAALKQERMDRRKAPRPRQQPRRRLGPGGGTHGLFGLGADAGYVNPFAQKYTYGVPSGQGGTPYAYNAPSVFNPATSMTASSSSAPAPATVVKRQSTFPEQLQASGGFFKDLATAVATVMGRTPAPEPTIPDGGIERPRGTDWTTYALIGGGVLLAGAVTFALVKSAKKKGRK